MNVFGPKREKNRIFFLFNILISGLILFFILKLFYFVVDWGIAKATFIGSSKVCRLNEGGACWSFISEKFRLILFGLYPREEQWRPFSSFVLLAVTLIISKILKKSWSHYFFVFLFFAAFLFLILRGDFLGLSYIPSSKWGGLPLTIILSLVGILFSYPIGILLALGRRSKMPFIHLICVSYIELIRGVPLISLLFMSSVILPLFFPENFILNKTLRAQIAIILFSSAYMAEVVRGGLQAIGKGQFEGGYALGLSYGKTLRYIVLPQALKVVIPPTVNTAISLFKDTSLVIIISLYDLMYTMKLSLKDPYWAGFEIEAYVFVGFIYFIFCFLISNYSRRLEKVIKVSG